MYFEARITRVKLGKLTCVVECVVEYVVEYAVKHVECASEWAKHVNAAWPRLSEPQCGNPRPVAPLLLWLLFIRRFFRPR